MTDYIKCCPVNLSAEEFKRVKSGKQTEIYRPMITNWRNKLVGKNYDYMTCSCGDNIKYLAKFESVGVRREALHPEWGEKDTEQAHFVILIKSESS